jgi:hypothetical protein
MSEEEKRKLTIGHYIAYGAVISALISVTLGQDMIPGAEASSDTTMNLVFGGLIVGAIGGGVLGIF